MAWIIEEYVKQLPYIKERGDIESDTYNNAIMIEKVIDDMNDQNLISEFEHDILWAISAGYSYSEAARILNSHRLTISETFSKLTDRIAYILGGEFTDSALIERLRDSEVLGNQDVEELFKRGLIKANEE